MSEVHLPSRVRVPFKLIQRRLALIRAALGGDVSQASETTYLKGLIHEGFPQSLVDVGAYDGVINSTSFAFVQSNFRAILIEPLPQPFKWLSKTYADHPNVTCINKACSNTTGRQSLRLGAAGGTGMTATLCTDGDEWFPERRNRQLIDVAVDTLTNILTENDWPRDFGLLLIDSEGMDFEVLLGLDFTRFRPRIVVTEEYHWNAKKHESKYQLLRENNYTLRTPLGSNTVWTSNEQLL
jgi:FkbM family methyltransferase